MTVAAQAGRMLARLALALCAALSFVAGSMLMKPAAGFTRMWPSVAVFGCFAAGLVFDVLLVRVGGEVGAAAVLTIGLEVVLAAVFANWIYDERFSGQRFVAVVLVAIGVLLLTFEASESPARPRDPSPVEPFTQLRPARDAELRVDPLEVGVDRAA